MNRARELRGPWDGCWVWTGATSDGGYGIFREHPKRLLVHRAVFDAIYGFLPPVVMHKCDNPPCFRPDHLLAGTITENNRDMAAKGRNWRQRQTHCVQGHEYTPENTVLKHGRRNCRACIAACDAARYARKKAQLLGDTEGSSVVAVPEAEDPQ